VAKVTTKKGVVENQSISDTVSGWLANFEEKEMVLEEPGATDHNHSHVTFMLITGTNCKHQAKRGQTYHQKTTPFIQLMFIIHL